jgi:hypothetical protein
VVEGLEDVSPAFVAGGEPAEAGKPSQSALYYPAVTAEALAALDLASRDARDNTTLRRAQRQQG